MSELNRDPGKYEQLLLDNQLCFPLYAAARKVVNEYNPLLKPYGLTYTQYIVFLALWEKEDGKAKVGCLGKRLYLDCGTLTPPRTAENTADCPAAAADIGRAPCSVRSCFFLL